jgi:hypothetical protein
MAVTPETIATALGRTVVSTTPEYEQWAMWIGDAEMLIQARKTELGIVPELDAPKYDYVVREAVVNHVRRPDDATQVTISIQDASTSRAYTSGKGRVVILDEWWVLLGLTSPAGGAFSIDTFGGAAVHAAMCSLNFAATYCSCGADLTNYAYPLFGGPDYWGY